MQVSNNWLIPKMLKVLIPEVSDFERNSSFLGGERKADIEHVKHESLLTGSEPLTFLEKGIHP